MRPSSRAGCYMLLRLAGDSHPAGPAAVERQVAVPPPWQCEQAGQRADLDRPQVSLSAQLNGRQIDKEPTPGAWPLLALLAPSRVITNARTQHQCTIEYMLRASALRFSCMAAGASAAKRKMVRIGTHSGSFHADEALGCFLLKQTQKFAAAKVVRTRDPEVLKDLDVVIDVGGVYEPGAVVGRADRPPGRAGGPARAGGLAHLSRQAVSCIPEPCCRA